MKNIFVKIFTILTLAIALNVATPVATQAQCPMCKIAAESNYKHGGQTGKGLNAGILYMLATPYLLVGGLAFVWWRHRRNANAEDEEFEA